MKEYIVAEHPDFPYEEPKPQELIRCKDCKYFSQTTLGMDFACWHGAYKVWGETGEHEGHSVCTRIESENHYCGYGERKK